MGMWARALAGAKKKSGHIFKVDALGFADGLHMGHGGKKNQG